MASKMNSIETEWARAPPPSGPAWRRMANVIYNPDEKSFLGRTAKRWGIMLIFYSVFYAVLALLFSACMGGLFLTIDPKTPSYTLEKSLIGNNPGVAYRPLPEFGLNIQYNLTGYDVYTEQLNEFLAPYQRAKLVTSEECTAQDGYGYPESPCFFVKLNKIINWEPECYDDAANLPTEMPQDLQDHIKALDASKTKQIWFSCWEEKTNTTRIEYPWGRGLPAAHYPYVNSEGYLSPVLAVRLAPPVNTPVAIRCRFWAKNIIYNKSMKEPSGYTRIPLTIADSSAPSEAEVKA